MPRRFASRNDSPDPLSFRGGPTGRRGNPSFLRWTGVRAAEIVGPYGKKGKLPRPPGQRLAKRKARKEQLVKFDFCPTTSECSTAHNVRKSQQSPARAPVGITLTEQHSLEPRPAARQGASRARNCAAIKRFFDGSTAVFFLGPQKENGGGKPAGLPRHLRSVDRPARRGVVTPPYGGRGGGTPGSSCPTGDSFLYTREPLGLSLIHISEPTRPY